MILPRLLVYCLFLLQAFAAASGYATVTTSVNQGSSYSSQSNSSGGSLGFGSGLNIGINGGQSSVNNQYNGAAQVSGIFAGTGGFVVDVAGTTTLNGGQILSSESAQTAGLNQFRSKNGVVKGCVI